MSTSTSQPILPPVKSGPDYQSCDTPASVVGVPTQQQPPLLSAAQLYPFTSFWMKPWLIPQQIIGMPPLNLPGYDSNRPVTGWTSELSDCCVDPMLCVDTTLCVQCYAMKHAYLTRTGYQDPSCPWYLLYLLVDLCCYFILTPAVAATSRVRVAQYFHINMAEHNSECCKGFWCPCLSLSQVQRELHARGVQVTGFLKSAPNTVYSGAPPLMR